MHPLVSKSALAKALCKKLTSVSVNASCILNSARLINDNQLINDNEGNTMRISNQQVALNFIIFILLLFLTYLLFPCVLFSLIFNHHTSFHCVAYQLALKHPILLHLDPPIPVKVVKKSENRAHPIHLPQNPQDLRLQIPFH